MSQEESSPFGNGKGCFVEPTVFDNVGNEMTIAQEEIFGPVLAVIPFDEVDDADSHRQRHALRPRSRSLDPRRREGASRRSSLASRNGVDQHVQ